MFFEEKWNQRISFQCSCCFTNYTFDEMMKCYSVWVNDDKKYGKVGVCDVCGKKSLVGNNRSHAMNATKRRFKPNLHKIKAEIEGKPQRIKICSSCLKANKVKKIV